MDKRRILKVNNVEIDATDDVQQFVTIKPICEALNIDLASQYKKIKRHPVLKDHWTLIRSLGKNGKRYEMLALPLKYVYGWLFTINPLNVPVEKRPLLNDFTAKYYKALYILTVKDKHTIAQYKEEVALLDSKIELLNLTVELTEKERDCVQQRCDTYKRQLDIISQPKMQL